MSEPNLSNNGKAQSVKHNIILDEIGTQFYGKLHKPLSLIIGEWTINNQTGELREKNTNMAKDTINLEDKLSKTD